MRAPRRLISPRASVLLVLVLSTITGGTPTVAQSRGDFLAENIDATVSPRDDFFRYANGGWLKRNPMPDTAAEWGIVDLLSDEVDARMRRISEAAAAKTAKRGSDEQLVGDFWFTAMNEAALNTQGLAPLEPDLDRIDQVQSIADVIDIVADMHRRNFTDGRVLFGGLIWPDEADGSRWIYHVRQGGIMIFDRSHFTGTDARTVRAREAFHAYLSKTFLRLHGDAAKAKASADAVYGLLAQLATGFEPKLGDQKMGLDELSRLAPTIGWDRYLRRLGLDPAAPINMRSVRFFQTLDSLLRTTPLETWKDYLRVWLVRMNVAFLDDTALEDYFAYDSVLTGARRPRPRAARVLSQLQNFTLGQPLARLYVTDFFPAALHARYEAVAASMREAFRDRILRVEWLSEGTRQATLRKLARLRITFGFGDLSMDFSTMPIRRDSYAQNVMRAQEWNHDQKVKQMNRPVDPLAGDPRPSWTDAEYDNSRNAVALSPGALIVPPGWRAEELDDAFIYGATFLGHEISHGFDSEGRTYDADGNKVDWWMPAEIAAFVERSERLVDQYNEFEPLAGSHIDGRRTLPENMADVTGVRIALDAFKKTEQFKKGERIGGFTPLQRFFLSFAYGYMRFARPEAIASRLSGLHAPQRERVNGVLMNIPEFYEAFDVRAGDRMYRAEHLRAKIW